MLVFAAAIVGGAALFEIYSYMIYPFKTYASEGLPPLAVGVEHEYDFFKDGEQVGRYVFWVERIGRYKGETAYFSRSLTFIVYQETAIELETVYIFNEDLNPLEYRLNASLGEDRQSIVCILEGWTVDASLEMQDRSLDREVELPVDTVLIDTNMLGHWELFFRSFEPPQGKRVRFTMFVPQLLDIKSTVLVVDKRKETLTLNGVPYECQVVRASDLNIIFYLHDGNLLKLEESVQNIEVVATSG